MADPEGMVAKGLEVECGIECAICNVVRLVFEIKVLFHFLDCFEKYFFI